ncbi:MAG: amidophosphoribosyltransferase [Candidatus Bathyarchaeia archaeon]
MLKPLKEACGVFGAQDFRQGSVFPYIYWGLRSQNHRGHQSHGFVTFNGKFNAHRSLDLVPKIEKGDIPKWLNNLPGHVGVGSVRYTTSGGTDKQALMKGTQPFLAETEKASIAIAFNGNIVNNSRLKKEIRRKFPGFSYECDAELICRKLLLELENGDLVSSVTACMEEIEGAFSVVGMTKRGELFAFKDPYGIRPLCSGYSGEGEIRAVSSESVGLDINGFEFDFEVKPGELVVAAKDGFVREQCVRCEKKAFCGFEFSYFARPDSRLGDRYVYEVREDFGRNLAREYSEITEDADIIISIPQTADDAAYGLHEETGIRWERASRRHRYVTERAFILLPRERHSTIDRKINILDRRLHGKNVIVVEDSIVRGDTTKTIIRKLRSKGAKRIDLYITFPRIIGPCFYGIDMATYGELIGSKHKAEEIAEMIDADTVNYQSPEGFIRATGFKEDELCLGCVTGEYPTPLAQKMADEMRERFEKGYEETGRIYELMSEQTVS